MHQMYKTSFAINGKNIEVVAKLWKFTSEETVDMWITEDGEHVWRNPMFIYSLKDASTHIRHRYKAKGMRVKWVLCNESTESA